MKKNPYAHIPAEQWNDWTWQLKNRLNTIDDVIRVLNPSEKVVEGIKKATANFRMAITPYYASLIDLDDPYCPVKAQAIPTEDEANFCATDLADPLHEDVDSPTPGLTHRYPDRVLLLITDICSMYCRHCTRRRLVGVQDKEAQPDHVKKGIEYIAAHPEVRDVVISGGDPLTVSDRRLEEILKALRAIPHVEIIRIGTRTPVVLPMRITDELVAMMKKYHPIYINTHFNHAKEITPEAAKACARLADGGFPIGNQCVLLRNVNDSPAVMKQLNQKLLSVRVRPYYIYQCDLSKGISHFRTSIGKGMEIMESLRGHTSGLAVPTYVVDLPGGGGKTPVMPNYLISMSDSKVVLRNFEGKIMVYEQPKRWDSIEGHDPACKDEKYLSHDGPAMLMRNPNHVLVPDLKSIGDEDHH